jgi:hypothetical protein
MLAIVMLALGIGVNAAVFGVVKSVLLDSLPYADADRLVHIYSVFDASDMDRSSTSPGAAADLEQQLRSFSQITSFRFGTYEVTYMSEAGPRVLSATLVTDGFFATLGVRAAQGRTFTADDGKAYMAMLSHEAWQRELGGAVDVVGRTLQLSGAAYEIIGILPPRFVGPMGAADVWFSFDLAAVAAQPGARDQHWLGMVGRLAPGASVQRAQRELNQAASALTRAHPQSDKGRAFAAVPLRAALVGDTRTPLRHSHGQCRSRPAHHLREPGRRAVVAHAVTTQGVRCARVARRRARATGATAPDGKHATRDRRCRGRTPARECGARTRSHACCVSAAGLRGGAAQCADGAQCRACE